jgi:hypothetical protein
MSRVFGGTQGGALRSPRQPDRSHLPGTPGFGLFQDGNIRAEFTTMLLWSTIFPDSPAAAKQFTQKRIVECRLATCHLSLVTFLKSSPATTRRYRGQSLTPPSIDRLERV